MECDRSVLPERLGEKQQPRMPMSIRQAYSVCSVGVRQFVKTPAETGPAFRLQGPERGLHRCPGLLACPRPACSALLQRSPCNPRTWQLRKAHAL
jgi:hypothetical protein